MVSGQAFINLLADRAVIYNDTAARPFTAVMDRLRRIIAVEQAAMSKAGVRQRTDVGVMALTPASGGKKVIIPTKILIGADAPHRRGWS